MQSPRYPHGAYIRAQRLALGLSQPALARAARITPAMISRLETGHRRGRPPMLRALAEALEVPVVELLRQAGYLSEAIYWAQRQEDSEHPQPRPSVQYAVS